MNCQENDNYFDECEVVKDKPQTFFVYSFSNVKKKKMLISFVLFS